MKSVAVIGAGASGLCMARYLSMEPKLFKVVVFEQGSEIGGTWIYDDRIPSIKSGSEGLNDMMNENSVFSSMYKSLRTNLPKQVMEYPDFPYSEGCKTFVTHNQVLAYYQAYSSHFCLEKFIRFKQKVTDVRPSTYSTSNNVAMKWELTSTDIESNASTVAEFDSIVVCNGHFSKPNLPSIPGIEHFHGSVLHSHFYRVPDSYKWKDVIVLGARSSGRDIAVEISKVARSVILSHRSLPIKTTLPSNISEKPSIKAVNEEGCIVFEDGSYSTTDAIVFCTGYQFDFPFLDKSCKVQCQNNRIAPLYKQVFNVYHPSMAFIGLQNVICPNQMFSLQARWVFHVLAGRKTLPTMQEMLHEVNAEFQSKVRAGIPENHFHRFERNEQWNYYNTISTLAGVEPIKKVVEDLYMLVSKERDENLLTYRETEYKVINDEEFVKVL